MKLVIDIVADFACPWCFIGTERLEQALAKHPEVEPQIVYIPFLLEPDIPREGVDLRKHLEATLHKDPTPTFVHAEREALASGIKLEFAKVKRYPDSTDAHSLVRHAHPLGTQRALARALFRAYFLEARDIGDAKVLTELGTAHGFKAAEVRAILASDDERKKTRRDAAESRSEGVDAVPLFVFAQRDMIAGTQSVKTFETLIGDALVRRD